MNFVKKLCNFKCLSRAKCFCYFLNRKLISKSRFRTYADVSNVIIQVLPWISHKRHMVNYFKKLFSIDIYLNIWNRLRIHPAPKDFVTESFKNFCQFVADCPAVALVVRPVLKVRPRRGRWIFSFEIFKYFKAYPWLYKYKFHLFWTNSLVFVRRSLRRSVPREDMAAAISDSRCVGRLLWSECRVQLACCCLRSGSSY